LNFGPDRQLHCTSGVGTNISATYAHFFEEIWTKIR
jgi:hypothetical protein